MVNRVCITIVLLSITIACGADALQNDNRFAIKMNQNRKRLVDRTVVVSVTTGVGNDGNTGTEEYKWGLTKDGFIWTAILIACGCIIVVALFCICTALGSVLFLTGIILVVIMLIIGAIMFLSPSSYKFYP